MSELQREADRNMDLTREQAIIEPKKMWKLDAGGYCGVLMDTKTMRRIVKEAIRHEAAIRDILQDDCDNLVSYAWGLAEPDLQKQRLVFYRDKCFSVQHRIELFQARRPQTVDFYDVTDRQEALRLHAVWNEGNENDE